MRRNSHILAALPLLAVPLMAPAALADINGFGDFSGFSINQSDHASGPTLTANGIRLTGASSNQSRSIFALTPQTITQFAASFTYRAVGNPTPATIGRFGACFVLQNCVTGAQTVASVNSNVLGYGDLENTFDVSAAVSLQYGYLTSSSSSTGMYHDGFVTGGSASTTPVNLFNGNPINVSLSYNGIILNQTLTSPGSPRRRKSCRSIGTTATAPSRPGRRPAHRSTPTRRIAARKGCRWRTSTGTATPT